MNKKIDKNKNNSQLNKQLFGYTIKSIFEFLFLYKIRV